MGPLEKWLLANADILDLKVRFFDNPALEMLGIFDIEVQIQVAGQRYWGRGTSFDKNTALKKSCSEAIERFFLHKNKFLNSNGLSVHINDTLASKTAKLELIERDLFLCRYLTRTPFCRIQILNPLLESLKNSMSVQGVHLNFYSMGMINSTKSILCAIDGFISPEPFGFIFGTAAGELNSAIESSFLEAYRNYAHHRKDQSISLAEFNNKSRTAKIDFTDHGNLALDIQYALQLKYDFFGEVNFVEINESFEPEFNCEILNLSNTPFESAPISVVRASSEKLQNLFVGHATEQKLNRLRLERFCRAHNRSCKIYQLPHPFN